MSFKIIGTLENGKYRLWIAPSAWEEDNIIRWPKKHVTKLAKVADSVPGPDWQKMKCQVKRKNIVSYEDAENELSNMIDKTDTEEDDTRFLLAPSRKCQKMSDMNILVEQIIATKENQEDSTIAYDQAMDNEIVIDNYNTYDVLSPTNDTNISDTNKILNNHTQLFVNQNQILQHLIDNNHAQTKIIENQSRTMQKLASLSVQLDDVLMFHNQMQVTTPLAAAATTTDNIPFCFKSISSVEELDNFEKLLSDISTREQLRRTYSIVCSSGSGVDCAYTLIDVIFCREFLSECSWSASSRSDRTKISIKCYKNVVSFFWTMVRSWDANFSFKDNEEFFKKVLKNANKRKQAKQERASTSRNRAKQIPKTNVINMEEESNDPQSIITEESHQEEDEDESLQIARLLC